MLSSAAIHQPRLVIDDCLPEGVPCTLANDVLAGLTGPRKELPPKYFYDDRGSRLFDLICDQIEYYPTRTELALLHDVAPKLLNELRPNDLIELGSGAARKTRTLLDAAQQARVYPRYVPVDVSAGMLERAAARLLDAYPWLRIHGVVGDYEQHLYRIPNEGRRLVIYLGGTIGNFLEPAARRFLRTISRELNRGDHLLLGVDLVKDEEVLNAAYNDAAGVTAEFNLNMLRVINRELEGDFDLDAFQHVAFFNSEQAQIEMHLRSTRDQDVHLRRLGLNVHFERGETLQTEVSRKFTRATTTSLLSASGFRVREWFTPANQYFALALAEATGDGSDQTTS